jgi:hypothetical protein
MTSPRVIELPRRLEPVGRDTFLGPTEADAPRDDRGMGTVVVLRPRDDHRMGTVVALRPRDARGLRGRDRRPTPPAAA